ncbi:MAG: hypothetical protein FJX54_11700 [Alphaproteobacteria bacterium]|nr:hypothetical protein [Alphaproteobacteria bacterium]
MPKMSDMGPIERRINVRPGLTLYRRPKSSVWWMDVGVRGTRRVRASTGEEDVVRAGSRAWQCWERQRRISLGLPPEEAVAFESPKIEAVPPPPVQVYRTVGDVLRAYRMYLLTHAEQLDSSGRKPSPAALINSGIIANYLLPWWGPKSLNEVQESDTSAWKAWREEQTTPIPVMMNRRGKVATYVRNRSKPKPPTLVRERAVLLMAFAYGVQAGWIKRAERPRLAPLWWPVSVRTESDRRPAFTKHQKNKVLSYLRERRSTWHEKLFGLFVRVMFASGLRPGEALALRWSDLRDVRTTKVATLMVVVRGVTSGAKKTGSRKVIALPEVMGAVKELRKLHTSMKWPMERDDLLFVSKAKAPIATFHDDFRAMISALDLRPDIGEIGFTLYSCRHTYATLLLDAGLEALHIARNMGTSVRMIDKHYGQSDFEKTPELVIPM